MVSRAVLRARAFDTIVLGGFAAGVFDILDAFATATLNGGSAVRVLHTIASGLVGRGAYDGGAAAAVLGLSLHFVIALGAATTFLLASRALPALLRRPWITGPAFGLGVWAFMYYVVLPIAFNRPNTLPAWPALANQLGIHAFGVGLPIAWFASRSAYPRIARS